MPLLRVRDIANFDLKTCNANETANVFQRPDLLDIDQVPVKEDAHIFAVFERHGSIQRPLSDSVLVSADESLSSFIYTLRYQPYRLVLDGTNIKGIVTWSDLLKLPVFVFGYSLIAQLELLVNELMYSKYGDSVGWLERLKVLEPKKAKKVEDRKKLFGKNNLSLPAIEVADLVEKVSAMREDLPKTLNFDVEFPKIRKLRNDVAHMRRFVRCDSDLHSFVDGIETAAAWIQALQSTSQPNAHEPTVASTVS
jgi:hypothetical protein